jgi:signal transduction histidine kinase
MGLSAATHGKLLLESGYTIDQVVHDYGDLCQSITDLAVERDAPFSIDQFRTLNRCLDNAIADAVTEFSLQRDAVTDRQSAQANERLGVLVHELRNVLQTAQMSWRALESGKVAVGGTTGALLKRSLDSMASLLQRSVSEIRADAGLPDGTEVLPLASLVADAERSVAFDAAARGCTLVVAAVDPQIAVCGNRPLLLAALVNLLQNAFKFTRPYSEVALRAYADGARVKVDVEDHCGGLPANFAATMFRPFTQGGADRSGLGLGLSIARRSVEADGGTLTVRDVPGHGCVMTIELPRAAGAEQSPAGAAST